MHSNEEMLSLPTLDYWTEQRRAKLHRAKAKRGDQRKKPEHLHHLAKVGVETRFKKGQFVGSRSPRWKGGRYARYGISPERYDEMLTAQGGVCAICLKPPKKQRLNVDHSHQTGQVRGLLCFRCNYGMGWFQEDVGRLKRVESYLSSEKDWRCL